MLLEKVLKLQVHLHSSASLSIYGLHPLTYANKKRSLYTVLCQFLNPPLTAPKDVPASLSRFQILQKKKGGGWGGTMPSSALDA